ncbi:MAG: MFS transporter [Nitrospinota bacterium]|nr:MAG: MFS transporter [Nitrospinota bacterium]
MNDRSSPQVSSRFFYGWTVVGISVLTLTLAYGTRSSFSIFFVAMLEEFSWSRAALSAAFSIHSIVASVGVPLAGALIDRFGPRCIFPLGAAILALGLVATSRIHTLWQFYLCFGLIMALGRSMLSMGPHSAILANWFVRYRGTAMGIASAGPGMGMFLLSPLMQLLISSFGWRIAYLVFAGLILSLIPLLLTFQRLRPAELGLSPDGVTEKESPSSPQKRREVEIVDPVWAAEEWTPAKAMRTYRFWVLFGAFLFGNLTTIVLVHQVAFLVDVGYSKLFAASIFGLIGILTSLSTILFGTLSDRIGREAAYTIQTISALIAIALLLMIKDPSRPWLLYLYALLFGLGSRQSLPAMAADIFQGRHFGAIYGILAFGIAIDHIVGPWLGGYLFDLWHSYTIPFLASWVGVLLGCLCVWIAAPRKVRRVRRSPSPEAPIANSS